MIPKLIRKLDENIIITNPNSQESAIKKPS